ncbi:unnamed protein product [Bursaphelenchus xylophilus]|uniref:(pine wood nematode) hypothetical protein n=1 Tax=Bursaphelenchus xylophilus TaxID=6326 RepID=A0A1I7RLV1_BURXY|nr:unnamed protein product [Bursaphelenchus xylophilus]CAG9106214.1 unnamed protein product [Bursaphelenchus xylophilus]
MSAMDQMDVQMYSEFEFDKLDRLEWKLNKNGSKKLLSKTFSDLHPILCTEKLVKFFAPISKEPEAKVSHFPMSDSDLVMQCVQTISSRLEVLENPLKHLLNDETELRSEEELLAEMMEINRSEDERMQRKKCGAIKNGAKVHEVIEKAQTFCMKELLPKIRPDLVKEELPQIAEEPIEEEDEAPKKKRGPYKKKKIEDPVFKPHHRNLANGTSVSSRGRVCKRISKESLDYDPNQKCKMVPKPKKGRPTKKVKIEVDVNTTAEMNSTADSSKMDVTLDIMESRENNSNDLNGEDVYRWLNTTESEAITSRKMCFSQTRVVSPSEASSDSGVGPSTPPDVPKNNMISILLRRQGYGSFV